MTGGMWGALGGGETEGRWVQTRGTRTARPGRKPRFRRPCRVSSRRGDATPSSLGAEPRASRRSHKSGPEDEVVMEDPAQCWDWPRGLV